LVVPQHFAFEPALLPGEVEAHAKCLGGFADVAFGHRPVHEPGTFPPVDQVVPPFDFFDGHAGVEQG
jgi:hypothetical protein